MPLSVNKHFVTWIITVRLWSISLKTAIDFGWHWNTFFPLLPRLLASQLIHAFLNRHLFILNKSSKNYFSLIIPYITFSYVGLFINNRWCYKCLAILRQVQSLLKCYCNLLNCFCLFKVPSFKFILSKTALAKSTFNYKCHVFFLYPFLTFLWFCIHSKWLCCSNE